MRLGIIGSGAVARKRYLPAVARVPELEVTHLVDLEIDRARELASEFAVGRAVADHRELAGEVDVVVVATPPATHRGIVVDSLEAGLHVLCEKPLAATTGDVEAMIEAHRGSGCLLSVGMIRRVGRSAGLLRELLGRRIVGPVHRVEIEEGGTFGWPLRTGHVFQSNQGGVLRDTGTHLLDLLLWITGAEEFELLEYEDDSWGGPEANARVEMALVHPDGRIPVGLEVSFTRELDNRIRIQGDEGALETATLGGWGVTLEASGLPGGEARVELPGESPRSRVDDFALQLERFVRAVREDGPPPVPAEEALPTVSFVERCYGSRAVALRSWEAAPPGAQEPRHQGEAVRV